MQTALLLLATLAPAAAWVDARAGAMPGHSPTVVRTRQKLLLTGSEVFYAMNDLRTGDLGRSWQGPTEHAAPGRREESGQLPGIGHTVRYEQNQVSHGAPWQTVFSFYDAAGRPWAPWARLPRPHEARFLNAGAGSLQRVDLSQDCFTKGDRLARVAVLHWRFAGRRLIRVETGNELALPERRGLVEPSLTRFGGRFFLAIRRAAPGFVATSADGLCFGLPQRRPWEDGTDLGNHNTQTHWVTHQDSLYLVYTREGAINDHVFRRHSPRQLRRHRSQRAGNLGYRHQTDADLGTELRPADGQPVWRQQYPLRRAHPLEAAEQELETLR